jgi:hypothetical protein
LEPSDISDHGSTGGSGVEELMTEDDETDDHTMEDVPAAENVPAESEPVDSQHSDEDLDDEESNEEESDEEGSDKEPLEAASRWPSSPSKQEIARLTKCSGLDDDTSKGRLPVSTARDAVVNALASVKFLREIGEAPLNPNDIGIASDGCLFKISGRSRRNHRLDFSAMVSNLQENTKYEEIRGQMRAYMAAEMNICFRDTEELASLIRTMLQTKAIGIPKLESVAAKCREVVVVVDEIITLLSAVKLDLLDTGSTSLKRWNELQSTQWHIWLPDHLMSGAVDIPAPANIDQMVEGLTYYVSILRERLGATLKLTRDLEFAIAHIFCL